MPSEVIVPGGPDGLGIVVSLLEGDNLGVAVVNIHPDSTNVQELLQPGDIITSINGRNLCHEKRQIDAEIIIAQEEIKDEVVLVVDGFVPESQLKSLQSHRQASTRLESYIGVQNHQAAFITSKCKSIYIYIYIYYIFGSVFWHFAHGFT